MKFRMNIPTSTMTVITPTSILKAYTLTNPIPIYTYILARNTAIITCPICITGICTALSEE